MIAKPRLPLVLLFYISVGGVVLHAVYQAEPFQSIALSMLAVTSAMFGGELLWGRCLLSQKRLRHYYISLLAVVGFSLILVGFVKNTELQSVVQAGIAKTNYKNSAQ